MSCDMILVCMPFAELPRPPLAPGLLAAILKRDGLSCETLHAHLLFAERIGLEDWMDVAHTPPNTFVLEYLFSHVAFPDTFIPLDEFIRALEGRHWSMRGISQSQFPDLFHRIQKQAMAFIDELSDSILAKNPAAIGCSSTFIQQVPSLALLRVIKEKSPSTVTMLGGANCETVMGRAAHRNCPWIDVVVSGEADGVISSLVHELANRGAELPISDVPDGVFVPDHRTTGYPSESGRLSHRSLNELPIPDYHEFFETLGHCPSLMAQGNFALTAESSRGCWWGKKQGCTFCGLNGKGAGYAVKEPRRFLNELEELSRRYEIKRFSLTDNIISKDYFTTFLPLLKEIGAPYNLFYETKSNLKRKHVEAFRQAGVFWIQPGIESLSSDLLTHMHKGAKAWEHVNLLKLVLEYGMRAQWFILHDFPGEKDEWYAEMAELVPLLTHLQPPVNMMGLQYCRFSTYHNDADSFGLELAAPPMARFAYPFDTNIVEEFMYTFEPVGGRTSAGDLPSMLMEMPAKRRLRSEIGAWMARFWNKRPILEVSDDGSVLTVRDTRSVAVKPEHRLEGMARELYLQACEVCPLVAEMELSGDMDRLLADRLAVLLDGRLVGLAVPPARYPFPQDCDYPGGKFKKAFQNQGE